MPFAQYGSGGTGSGLTPTQAAQIANAFIGATLSGQRLTLARNSGASPVFLDLPTGSVADGVVTAGTYANGTITLTVNGGTNVAIDISDLELSAADIAGLLNGAGLLTESALDPHVQSALRVGSNQHLERENIPLDNPTESNGRVRLTTGGPEVVYTTSLGTTPPESVILELRATVITADGQATDFGPAFERYVAPGDQPHRFIVWYLQAGNVQAGTHASVRWDTANNNLVVTLEAAINPVSQIRQPIVELIGLTGLRVADGATAGLTEAEVDARVAAGVADWAEAGDGSAIPTAKLGSSTARLYYTRLASGTPNPPATTGATFGGTPQVVTNETLQSANIPGLARHTWYRSLADVNGTDPLWAVHIHTLDGDGAPVAFAGAPARYADPDALEGAVDTITIDTAADPDQLVITDVDGTVSRVDLPAGGGSSGGGGGGFTTTEVGEATIDIVSVLQFYGTGLTIPTDADWLLINTGRHSASDPAEGEWHHLRVADLLALTAISGTPGVSGAVVETAATGSATAIALHDWRTGSATGGVIYFGRTADNQLLYGANHADRDAMPLSVRAITEGAGGGGGGAASISGVQSSRFSLYAAPSNYSAPANFRAGFDADNFRRFALGVAEAGGTLDIASLADGRITFSGAGVVKVELSGVNGDFQGTLDDTYRRWGWAVRHIRGGVSLGNIVEDTRAGSLDPDSALAVPWRWFATSVDVAVQSGDELALYLYVDGANSTGTNDSLANLIQDLNMTLDVQALEISGGGGGSTDLTGAIRYDVDQTTGDDALTITQQGRAELNIGGPFARTATTQEATGPTPIGGGLSWSHFATLHHTSTTPFYMIDTNVGTGGRQANYVEVRISSITPAIVPSTQFALQYRIGTQTFTHGLFDANGVATVNHPGFDGDHFEFRIFSVSPTNVTELSGTAQAYRSDAVGASVYALGPGSFPLQTGGYLDFLGGRHQHLADLERIEVSWSGPQRPTPFIISDPENLVVHLDTAAPNGITGVTDERNGDIIVYGWSADWPIARQFQGGGQYHVSNRSTAWSAFRWFRRTGSPDGTVGGVYTAAHAGEPRRLLNIKIYPRAGAII